MQFDGPGYASYDRWLIIYVTCISLVYCYGTSMNRQLVVDLNLIGS